VRDPITRMVKDRKTKLYESEIIDAGIDDKRLLVAESEFANVLKVMTREGNTLSPVLRGAWDSGDLRSMKCVVDERARPCAFVQATRLEIHSLGLIPLTERCMRSRQVVGPSRRVLDQPGAIRDIMGAAQVRNRFRIRAV